VKEQDGSVSVIVAAIVAAMVVLGLGAADLARVLVAASRAQTAADAASLAAAQELALPSDRSPEEIAAEYAARNAAELVRCACEEGGLEATVDVVVPVGPLLLFEDDRVVRASARAVVETG
jgi:secretion/DNA translocation related TadE-like protein